MTIPTRGSHPDLLEGLIADSGLPPDHVIIVRTSPDAALPTGVRVVDDFGPLNIQRWWNRGISTAQELGATRVAVLNDDLRVAGGALQRLDRALVRSGASIATPGPSERIWRRDLPTIRKVDGAIWILNLAHGLRPNESYVWGWGDDDLDLRARRVGGGVVTVPIEYEHVHHNKATSESEELTALSQADSATFRRSYPLVWGMRRGRVRFAVGRALAGRTAKAVLGVRPKPG